MEACGCAGMELRSTKRKRFTEAVDDSVPSKRRLTEEAMTAFMDQLNLSPAPSLSSHPLNITTITTTCPASVTCYPNEPLTRGATPSHTSLRGDKRPLSTCQSQLGSSTADNSVHIRVTPATPSSDDSSASSGQEDWEEPMEDASLSATTSTTAERKSRRGGTVLEDLSSDSSDSEMSQRVWIAPELQSLTAAGQRRLLHTPVLDKIARNALAVVPWVNREKYLTDALSRRSQEADDDSDSEDDDKRSPAHIQDHDDYIMH